MRRRQSCFWGLVVAAVCLASVFVALALLAGTRQVQAATEAEICDVISVDATWSRLESPYTVTCDTTLDPGVRLDVEPGVEVRFAPGVKLTVKGTLVASGTWTLPITFTSNRPLPSPGDWGGLWFEAGSSASVLRWCTIEYATSGVSIYATNGDAVSPAFADCTVRENAQYGIQVMGRAYECNGATASPSIVGCTIEQNGASGIYYYGHGSDVICTTPGYGVAGGTVSNSVIRSNGQGIRMKSEAGHLFSGRVDPLLDGNRIVGNAGIGISMEGDDPIQATIQNNLIYDNAASGIAWAADDLASDPQIVNNTIVANGQDGIACSGARAGNTVIENNLLVANDRYGLSCTLPPYPQIAYNDVWANALGAYDDCQAGVGNVAADPCFVDAAAGDFALVIGSPCIDAGSSAHAPDADVEGVLRPQGEGVDMGAYEFWLPEIRVKQGAMEIGEGSELGFGLAEVGSSRAISFTVGNLGSRALIVEAVDVWPTEHFTVAIPGELPLAVAAGVSTTFDLFFAPGATGEHTATVSIASDDPDEARYRFILSGRGVQSIGGLSVRGPQVGLIHRSYSFTATVQPLTVTQPVTYAWRATGHAPVTNTFGLSGSLSLAWDVAGPQLITVTAANLQNRMLVTHAIALFTPVAGDFVADPISGPVPLAVAFTNTSTGDYGDSLWDFGDGVTSTLKSPTHTYGVPGAYTVELQISGPGGRDERTKEAYIVVDPYRVYLPLSLRADSFYSARLRRKTGDIWYEKLGSGGYRE